MGVESIRDPLCPAIVSRLLDDGSSDVSSLLSIWVRMCPGKQERKTVVVTGAKTDNDQVRRLQKTLGMREIINFVIESGVASFDRRTWFWSEEIGGRFVGCDKLFYPNVSTENSLDQSLLIGIEGPIRRNLPMHSTVASGRPAARRPKILLRIQLFHGANICVKPNATRRNPIPHIPVLSQRDKSHPHLAGRRACPTIRLAIARASHRGLCRERTGRRSRH